MRVLKKKLQREGLFRELKRKKYYEKPSERRVREKGEAVRRPSEAEERVVHPWRSPVRRPKKHPAQGAERAPPAVPASRAVRDAQEEASRVTENTARLRALRLGQQQNANAQSERHADVRKAPHR